jgi:hypothetical protein
VAEAERLQTAVKRLRKDRVLADLLVAGVPRDVETHRRHVASLGKLGPLQAESREELEQTASTRPDLQLILAAEYLRTGRKEEAFAALGRVAKQFIARPDTPAWVIDEALLEFRNVGVEEKELTTRTHLLKFAGAVGGLLTKETSGQELKKRLAKAECELRESGAPLPGEIRSAMEIKSLKFPEIEIILAVDDRLRGSVGTAFERLVRLLGKLGQSDRVSNAALEAWNDSSRNADAQVQEQLQKAAISGSNEAWVALALVRLQNGTRAASATGRLG